MALSEVQETELAMHQQDLICLQMLKDAIADLPEAGSNAVSLFLINMAQQAEMQIMLSGASAAMIYQTQASEIDWITALEMQEEAA